MRFYIEIAYNGKLEEVPEKANYALDVFDFQQVLLFIEEEVGRWDKYRVIPGDEEAAETLRKIGGV